MDEREKQIMEIQNKIYNGQKITLEEFLMCPERDALEAGFIACPKKDCEGTIALKDSRYGYGQQYLGCSSDRCNFFTTIHKLLGKTKAHPRCPYCLCPIIPKKQ